MGRDVADKPLCPQCGTRSVKALGLCGVCYDKRLRKWKTALADGKFLRQCRGCGRWFRPSGIREMYCPDIRCQEARGLGSGRLKRSDVLKREHPEARDRLCLKCRKPFRSHDFGNRLCVKCNHENAGVSDE